MTPPASDLQPHHITGLVLAGGRGSRMGGVDKGLQHLDGRPLAAHALERLAPQVGELMINANRHLETYRGLGPRVVTAPPGETTRSALFIESATYRLSLGSKAMPMGW